MSHQKPPHCHCHGVSNNETDRRLWHITNPNTVTVTESHTIRQTDDYVIIKNPHTVTVTESQKI